MIKIYLIVLLFINIKLISCSPFTDNDVSSILTQSSEFVKSAEPNIATLKYVALVTRHGSRTPLMTWPSDPYPYTNPKFWPNGIKQLTNLGKEQLYHTGRLIKTRYQGFIDPIYRPDSSEITYNPYDRDFMSAACLSAGMYPPDGPQLWNPNLLWQPVILSQRNFDICDISHSKTCPKFARIQKEQIKKYNQNTEKYKDLIDYVSQNTGTNFRVLSSMFNVYDTLLMQVENGFKVPQWTKQVFPYKLQPVATNYFVELFGGSEELIQLAAGPELKFISERLTMKANGTYGDIKKFYIEAAHDCTLMSLLKALGNNDPNLEIHTGSFVIFELHQINSDYILKVIHFKTSYDMEPTLIDIKGCPNPCNLIKFNELVDKINPPDWNKACKT